MLLARVQLVDAFLALFFGSSLLLAPELLLSTYGAHTDAVGVVVARLLGSFILGYAGVCWYTAREAGSGLGSNIIRTQILISVLGFVVIAAATIAGTVNILGWGQAILFAGLGSARVYGLTATPGAIVRSG